MVVFRLPEVVKLQTGTNISDKGLFFVRMFEILNNKNFAPVNLLSFSAPTFRFEVFFTKNTTSQMSVDGFKVSVVRLSEMSVL